MTELTKISSMESMPQGMNRHRSDMPVINIIPGGMQPISSINTDKTAKFGGENNDSND